MVVWHRFKAAKSDWSCADSSRDRYRLHLGIAGSKLIPLAEPVRMTIEQSDRFPWLEQPDSFFRKVKEGLAAIR